MISVTEIGHPINEQLHKLALRAAQKSKTYTVLTQTLDDVVEVGTRLLPIRRQLAHVKSGLLSEDVCLEGSTFSRHASQSFLLGQLSGGLSTHSSHL